MPNIEGVRKLLPVVVHTEEWQCCGNGVVIHEALGNSQWLLLAQCLTCGRKLVISKRTIWRETHTEDAP